jgi:hypothetical protein
VRGCEPTGVAASVLLRRMCDVHVLHRQVIWNGRMREELLELLEAQRAAPAADGTPPSVDGFRYGALDGELVVAGVFVRLYNEQPAFAIADPSAFCKVCCGLTCPPVCYGSKRARPRACCSPFMPFATAAVHGPPYFD